MTVRRAFFWAAGGQILSFLLNFASSVIVARLLTPTEVGTFTIGSAAAALCTAVTTFNVGAYIISEPDLPSETMDTAFTINGLISLGLSLAMLAGAVFSHTLLGSAEAGHVMLVLSVTPLIGAATFRPATMLQRDLQFKAVTLINLASVVVGTVATVITAWLGESYMSLAWGVLATSLSGAVGFLVVGARHNGLGVGLKGWRAMTAFGFRMTTITGAATATARLSDIILGRMLGLYALGIYSRASGLANQVFFNVYGTATRVAFSQLSKDYRERGELKTSFLHSFRLITALMWPFLVGFAILSPVAIHLLYGDKWMSAALPLALLLLAQTVTLAFGMNWELFVIRKETATQTRIELLRNIAGLTTFSIGALFSVGAAAAGRILDNLIGLLFYRKHVQRLSGADSSEIAQVYREGLALTVAAVLPALLLMIGEDWDRRTPLAAVVVAVMAGVACWYGVLVRLGHPLAHELTLLARKLLRLQPSQGGAR
ncbi:MAG: oligosaccharide flippase family protein [Sphingomonadales bacterium]|nr:oligosaccharide flippase family protein [Sphingomonadales bacterium]